MSISTRLMKETEKELKFFELFGFIFPAKWRGPNTISLLCSIQFRSFLSVFFPCLVSASEDFLDLAAIIDSENCF